MTTDIVLILGVDTIKTIFFFEININGFPFVQKCHDDMRKSYKSDHICLSLDFIFNTGRGI